MRQSIWMRWLSAFALTAASFFVLTTDPADAARRYAKSGSGCLPGVLKTRLSQIRARFGAVRVISTFRRGARIAGSGRRSLHASCRAVDFHPPRGKYRAVVNWLKSNHFGGIGTYSCGMHHIHIDNGPRVRFHHCVNRRGRPSRYAKRSRSRRYANKRRYRRSAYRARRSSLGRRATTRRRAASVKRAAARKKASSKFKQARFMRRLRQNGT